MNVYLSDAAHWQEHGQQIFSTPGCRPFIGISIGSRPLQPQTCQDILRWCLQCPHPLLPIMIADDIAYINNMVFSKYTRNYALKRARRDGDRHIAWWSDALTHLPEEQARRVRFVRWPEVETELYKRQVEITREEFQKGGLLHDAIVHQVQDYIERTKKSHSEERCAALAEYVIEEFPSLVFGIQVDGVQYQTSIYPTTHPSPMQNLLTYVETEPGLEELRAKLQVQPLEYNRLIEVLVPEECVHRGREVSAQQAEPSHA